MYSFDANVFISIARQHYPKDIFPSFWRQMEDCFMSGKIQIIELIYDELTDDDTKNCIDGFKDNIYVGFEDLESDQQNEIQTIVKDILIHTP